MAAAAAAAALAHRRLLSEATSGSSSSEGSSSSSSSGGGGSSSSKPAASEQAAHERRRAAAALREAGWSRAEVLNIPNALSMARLLSGPVIASWIMEGRWSLALPALAVSGASDWADGWAARRFNQPSTIGSYLDPLADKVLICSVVGALGWSGVLPAPVVVIILARDVLLVGGAFAARAKSLGWRWPGWSEFFRVQPPAAPAPAAAQEPGLAAAAAGGGSGSSEGAAGGGGRAPAAPLVQPLYISKVNTVFQLGLVGMCMLDAWLGWPGSAAIAAGSVATAGTTVGSLAAYVRAYRSGTVLAPAPAKPPPGSS